MTETIPKPPQPSLVDNPLNEEEEELLAKDNEDFEEDSRRDNKTYIYIYIYTHTHV